MRAADKEDSWTLMLEWVALCELFGTEAYIGVGGLLGCVGVAYSDGVGLVEGGVGEVANATWAATKHWLGVGEREIFDVLWKLTNGESELLEPYESYLFLVVVSVLLTQIVNKDRVLDDARSRLVRQASRF